MKKGGRTGEEKDGVTGEEIAEEKDKGGNKRV